MQRYALFPEHANFSGIFFVKKGISGLSLTWVKGMGRAYILYIYAHGREGGDGRKTEPRSKTAGHSGYNGRGTGDGRAPQPSCGEQDGRDGTRGAGRDGEGGMDLIRWAEVIRAACVW